METTLEAMIVQNGLDRLGGVDKYPERNSSQALQPINSGHREPHPPGVAWIDQGVSLLGSARRQANQRRHVWVAAQAPVERDNIDWWQAGGQLHNISMLKLNAVLQALAPRFLLRRLDISC
jgi:hypothetical protein